LGSIDPAGVIERPGEVIEEVDVPVENIVSRADRDRGQFVAKFDGIRLVGKEETTVRREAEPSKRPLLDKARDRLAQARQERQLEVVREEYVAGATEVDVEVSETTDAAKKTRAALRENQAKLDRVPTTEELDSKRLEDGKRLSVPVLGKIITNEKVPTEGGKRGQAKGTRQDLLEDLRAYRTALEHPDRLGAINKVLGRLLDGAYKVSQVGKKKEVAIVDTRIDKDNVTKLGTVRLQDYTIDEYINLIEEIDIEQRTKQQKLEMREKEVTALQRAVKVETGRPLDVDRVADNLKTIEERFVTRKGDKITLDVEGMTKFLDGIRSAKVLKPMEIGAVEKGINRLKREAGITLEKQKKPEGKTTVVVQTIPSTDVPGLKKLARLAGTKLRVFHNKAATLLRRGTRDNLLGVITGVYKPYGETGTIAEEGDVAPATIFNLSKAVDKGIIAKVYALANMYIFSQPEVAWITPDNTLDIEADSTSLGAYIKTKKHFSDSQFGKFYKEVQRVIGSNARLIRVSNFEYVIQDDSINKSQFARRVGRLQAKFGDKNGFQTEFFASKTETVTHNWAEDPLGASLRDRIRAEGFADILSFVDNRREAFLALAEEYGATTEELMFKEPIPAPVPKTKPRVRMSMPGYRPKEDESYLVDEAGFFSPMQRILFGSHFYHQILLAVALLFWRTDFC